MTDLELQMARAVRRIILTKQFFLLVIWWVVFGVWWYAAQRTDSTVVGIVAYSFCAFAISKTIEIGRFTTQFLDFKSWIETYSKRPT